MFLRAVYYGLTDGLDNQDPAAAKEWVDERLSKIAKFAGHNIPLWVDFFHEAGISAEHLQSVKDLGLLPFSSKRTLLSRPLDERLGIPEPECVKMSTSGTTGGPMPVYYSKSFFDYVAGLTRFRIRRMQGIPYLKKSVSITYETSAQIANDPNHKSQAPRRGKALGILNPLIGPLYDSMTKRLYISQSIQDIKRGLIDFKPSRLFGSPAYLRMLADLVRVDRSLDLHIDSAISIGEPLDENNRKYIESILRCEVFDGYGTNETGVIASECRCKSGLHIITDSIVVEVLRNGQPVGENEEGDVYVTTLLNKAMPLFRYDTGDRAILGGSNCKCGRRTRKLKSVEGRKVDYVSSRDGKMVSPRRIANALHSVQAPRCQLVETDIYQFVLRWFGEGKDVRKEVIESLYRELGDVDISVSDEKPDALRAKFRPVISRMSVSADNRWTQPLNQIKKII